MQSDRHFLAGEKDADFFGRADCFGGKCSLCGEGGGYDINICIDISLVQTKTNLRTPPPLNFSSVIVHEIILSTSTIPTESIPDKKA